MDDAVAGYKLVATKKQDRGDTINYTRLVKPDEKHGVKRMLEEQGYEVEVVEASEEDMRQAEQAQP